MREFAAAASQAIECLNFTWDSPSRHPGGAMPVLDTQMWVGCTTDHEELPEYCLKITGTAPRKCRKPDAQIILFEFYKKPMANKVTNRAINTLPEQQKVTGATQEVIMRMKNSSSHIPIHHTKDTLKQCMGELAAGG